MSAVRFPRRLTATLALAVPLAALAFAAPTASAATATASVTGGSLAFINGTPGNVTFPGTTLDGTDKTTTQTQDFNVNDARGTGAGWNVTATSTTFTSGGNTLPTTATTVASTPPVSCDAGISCTTATTSGVSYPYTLPAAGVAPTATKLFNASASTGLAAQTFTPTWQVAIPASTIAGTYTSTWTFSLTSGP